MRLPLLRAAAHQRNSKEELSCVSGLTVYPRKNNTLHLLPISSERSPVLLTALHRGSLLLQSLPLLRPAFDCCPLALAGVAAATSQKERTRMRTVTTRLPDRLLLLPLLGRRPRPQGGESPTAQLLLPPSQVTQEPSSVERLERDHLQTSVS